MAAPKLLGTVWLGSDGTVLISDFRDYVKVLEQARSLDPKARVMTMQPEEIPADAVQVL